MNPTSALVGDYVLDLSRAEDKERCDALVDGASVPDTYFRPAYILANEAAGQGKAFAVVVGCGPRRFLLPFLLRPLPTFPDAPAAPGFDAVTPYGYGGVLGLDGPAEVSDAPALLAALRRWSRRVGVVCCFLRLHPLLRQHEWLQSIAGEAGVCLLRRGTTFAIDLQQWDTTGDRIAGMRADRRSNLNRARKFLSTEWRSDSVEGFRQIYELTMRRLAAAESYLFPPRYFASLLQLGPGAISIAFSRFQGEIVGTALFFAGRDFAHYHLSGTTSLGRSYKAATLLINAGAQWARQRGCRWLHLGGGLHEGDDLSAFKRSFGGTALPYYTLSIISDSARYAELCELRYCQSGRPRPEADYFPQYRG